MHFSYVLVTMFAGFYTSVCSGVVAKVVKARTPPYRDSEVPAMLETTAAVHPGGSGGAVVNSNGSMVGLVTRYSKLRSLLKLAFGP